jgi:alpha-L-fucosidase
MKLGGEGIYGTRALSRDLAGPSEAPWSRWTQKGGRAWAFVDASGPTELNARPDGFELRSAALAEGGPVTARSHDGKILVDLPPGPRTGLAVVSFDLLGGGDPG